MTIRARAAAAALILAFYSGTGRAQTAPRPAEGGAGGPTRAVQALVTAAKQYADESAPGITAEEMRRRTAVREGINAILDLHEMARRILLKQWDALKPAERERYAGLLAALVQKIGYPQIEKYFNGKIELSYEGEKPLDDAAAVLTKIVYKEDDLTLSTEFHVRKTDRGWRVYDVVTDGESLLLIYRNQHMGIIKEKGFTQLLKLMEKKLNETR